MLLLGTPQNNNFNIFKGKFWGKIKVQNNKRGTTEGQLLMKETHVVQILPMTA